MKQFALNGQAAPKSTNKLIGESMEFNALAKLDE